jgi:hypothetical protein
MGYRYPYLMSKTTEMKGTEMKLIYTDTDGKGTIDVVHANTCREGQALLRKARDNWNWEVFQASTRDEVFSYLDSRFDLGDWDSEPEIHYCPCVTIA